MSNATAFGDCSGTVGIKQHGRIVEVCYTSWSKPLSCAEFADEICELFNVAGVSKSDEFHC